MSSSPPSDLLLADCLPLKRLADEKRDAQLGEPNLKHVNALSPSWPTPANVSSRPTAQGREPFTL